MLCHCTYSWMFTATDMYTGVQICYNIKEHLQFRAISNVAKNIPTSICTWVWNIFKILMWHVPGQNEITCATQQQSKLQSPGARIISIFGPQFDSEHSVCASRSALFLEQSRPRIHTWLFHVCRVKNDYAMHFFIMICACHPCTEWTCNCFPVSDICQVHH